MVVVSGLPGSGKTRLAEALGAELTVPVISLAWILGALTPLGLSRGRRRDAAYRVVGAIAEHRLRLGEALIVDGMVGANDVRRRWRQLADDYAALFLVIECVCSDPDLHRQRIESRDDPIPGWPDPGWEHFEEMRPHFAPWSAERFIADAIEPFEVNLERVIEWIQRRQGARK